jgi:uridine kinase
MNETRSVQSKPIVIVEGILIYADPRLLEQMDIKVFVDTPDDIRFIRRLRRDIADAAGPLNR